MLQRTKKIISLLLIFVLVLGLVPVVSASISGADATTPAPAQTTVTVSNGGAGGGVFVGEGSQFIMHGGEISDNQAYEGGGVAVSEGAHFDMRGGQIDNNQAQNGGGVSVGTRIDTPILEIDSVHVFTSSRLPGQYADGTATEDMGFNDLTLAEMLQISPGLHQRALLYQDGIGSATLRADARQLATMSTITPTFPFTPHPNRPIAQSMFDHFFWEEGADFRNQALSDFVFAHDSTIAWVDLAKNEILTYLQENSGDPRGIEMVRNTPPWQRLEGRRPIFNTQADMHNGLVIMIHDTWGRSVEIRDFIFDGTNFSGTMRVVIWDHFGLDTGDITTERSPLQTLVGGTSFYSWYVLQHYTGTQGRYVPMVTWFEQDIPFNGTIS